MERYVGVDAGGTQTRALLVWNDGRVAGFGRAGASNWNNVGLDAAVAAIRNSIAELVLRLRTAMVKAAR